MQELQVRIRSSSFDSGRRITGAGQQYEPAREPKVAAGRHPDHRTGVLLAAGTSMSKAGVKLKIKAAEQRVY